MWRCGGKSWKIPPSCHGSRYEKSVHSFLWNDATFLVCTDRHSIYNLLEVDSTRATGVWLTSLIVRTFPNGMFGMSFWQTTPFLDFTYAGYRLDSKRDVPRKIGTIDYWEKAQNSQAPVPISRGEIFCVREKNPKGSIFFFSIDSAYKQAPSCNINERRRWEVGGEGSDSRNLVLGFDFWYMAVSSEWFRFSTSFCLECLWQNSTCQSSIGACCVSLQIKWRELQRLQRREG